MTPNDIDKVVVTHKTKIQEGIEKKIVSSKTGIIKPRRQKKKVATTLPPNNEPPVKRQKKSE